MPLLESVNFSGIGMSPSFLLARRISRFKEID